MNNCVLGLDLSLTSTGWAIDADDERRKWGVIKTARRGASRLDHIDDAITRLIEAEMPDLVVIENYAFGNSLSLAALAELGGVVRLSLHRMGYRYIAVAPATLKKFVTGKGQAEKAAMMMHCLRNWNVEIGNNNAADAFGLCQFGRCYLDGTGFKAKALKNLRRRRNHETEPSHHRPAGLPHKENRRWKIPRSLCNCTPQGTHSPLLPRVSHETACPVGAAPYLHDKKSYTPTGI
ncbi:crossover junction endodeoxyribonuclease RuvC [Akkermansia muciniphila]|uniref:crossover junction endodeoxyribonuclease RuvC n=1 Tax=Akkermansia muciniphila TaxID=239935 RepID=UPI0027D34912|nr:crossover junction endodeoxyribonuclease RuvC [Akkermansia muciniphila]WMB17030.1 crossover junction endodeoxyribonuclease RuvC [Akkermansia muciniphila]